MQGIQLPDIHPNLGNVSDDFDGLKFCGDGLMWMVSDRQKEQG